MIIDPTLALLLVALVAAILPVLNWCQNRSITKQIAVHVAAQNEKLEVIHTLVNSRLSDALQTIEDLKGLLWLAVSGPLSPDDPRVQSAISKKS